MFPEAVCEGAAAEGQMYVLCMNGTKVRLDWLMPDLALADIERKLLRTYYT